MFTPQRPDTALDDTFPGLPHFDHQTRASYVHVWRGSLDVSTQQRKLLLETLSDEEAQRAKGIRSLEQHSRCIASRGLLRLLLARYCGVPASTIPLGLNRFGKPIHEPAKGSARVCFNVSHSKDVIVIAIAHGVTIGVDIEHIRPVPCVDSLAADVLNAEELELFRAISPDRRNQRFLEVWTHKEAFLKALGCGLAIPPRAIAIKRSACNLFHATQVTRETKVCGMTANITIGPAFQAALAVYRATTFPTVLLYHGPNRRSMAIGCRREASAGTS